MNTVQLTRSILLLASLTLITACGGGGGGGGGNPAAEGSNFDSGCTGFCATNSPANLTQADVGRIISQAVQEANSQGVNATIAVTDRIGNVLGLFQMNGAATTFTIRSGIVSNTSVSGLENLEVLPSGLAAIAKAVTGSYLASEGNAFSTRTASQIIQEHFNPGVANLPGGPLFGVQFSQLPCSDLVTDGTTAGSSAGVDIGPQRSPLGLSADPGGFPLYKNGHPVGGIGVIADGFYSLDRDIGVNDNGDRNDANYFDETIAIAGQFGFAPPVDRRANRITVAGNLLRYSDTDTGNLLSNPQTAPAYGDIDGGVEGSLIDDASLASANQQNYFIAANGLLDGSTFGTGASGIVDADTIDTTFAGLDAFVLSNAAGTANRYPPIDGAIIGGEQLLAADVTQLLQSALGVANQARAQIRRPLDSQARVTISVVDRAGTILGIVRTRDAPLFGTDVSLQKARTAAFFSSPDAGTVLDAEGDVTYLNANGTASGVVIDFTDYISTLRTFVGDGTALANGIAFADRSGGNLSRPFYPDGIDGNGNGPLSKAFITGNNGWSPFSDGIQLDLILNGLVGHLAAGTNATSCAGSTRIANGIQIFPGSVPIYRNGVLVGGIGVSGDGIEQDDMISFLGTNRAGIALTGNGIGTGAIIGNAPINPFVNANGFTVRRADSINTGQLAANRLRYVQCPQNPFINNNDENVCDGK